MLGTAIQCIRQASVELGLPVPQEAAATVRDGYFLSSPDYRISDFGFRLVCTEQTLLSKP